MLDGTFIKPHKKIWIIFMTIVTRIISTSLPLSKEINFFARNLIQLFLYICGKVNILHAIRAVKDPCSKQLICFTITKCLSVDSLIRLDIAYRLVSLFWLTWPVKSSQNHQTILDIDKQPQASESCFMTYYNRDFEQCKKRAKK